jgi:hypothetical protein
MGLGDVIACHFAPRIGTRFTEIVTPVEVEVRDTGLFFHLAASRFQCGLARFYHTLREIPISEDPEQQIMPLIGLFTDYDYTA